MCSSPFVFAESSETFSAGFSFGWQCPGGNVLKTEMARLMPGLGVLEQHPVQID